MKKLLLASVAAACCFPAIAQTYYQKVPKLIPQADGTYRVADGEYEFVPVDAAGRRISTQTAQEREVADRAEAARWAGVAPQQAVEVAPVVPAARVKEKPVAKKEEVPAEKTATVQRKNRPYLSIGASGMNTTLRSTEESAKFWGMGREFSDTQPGVKGTFGAWMSEYTRAEIFFQWRGEVSKSGKEGSIAYNAKAKMWDIGANAFLYANPHSNVRFFIGAGVAATRVQPKMTLNGIDINDVKLVIGGKTYRFQLFESKFCITPSGFVGVEFPLGENTDMDIMGFYSHTNVDKDGIDSIKSFGLAANIRFNLLTN